MSRAGAGIYGFWIAATIFVFSIAFLWILRYRSKAWENKRMIEHEPVNIEFIPVPNT